MKKICSVLLLFVLLMSTSVVSFANGNNEITFEEFEQLMKKYDLESVVVDESSLKDINVIKDLTKEELENLIIKGIEEVSKPLHFEEKIDMTDEILSLDFSPNANLLSNWETINRVTTLSKTFYSGDTTYFRLRASVAASYQYEYQWLPGEPGLVRNWKFTDADRGEIIHLNDGEYQMKRVSSKTSFTNDEVKQEYEGVVDIGTYVGIGDFSVRISLGQNDFSGMIWYTKSSV